MEQKTLGSFLAVLRKANGMTQKELAERVGVSDKTVSHWERDESAPDISVLPILADIFGVTVDELLRGEKAPADAEPSDALSQKSEKQLRYLMEKNFHKYEIGFWASLCTAFIGCLLAFLLYEWVAAPGAVIAAIFAVAAILINGIAAGNFGFSLKGADFSEDLIAEYNNKCRVWRWLAFLLIDGLIALVIGATAARLVPYRLPLLLPVPFIAAAAVLFFKEKAAFRD